MKTGLYSKLAWNNIKKNNRFFVPRILSEAGLLCCFYISMTLSMDDRLRRVKGGYVLPTFMRMGTIVLALLSVILMLYINSFVMKQRTREFGVYNVLGMEKRHIGKVLFRETLFSSLMAVAAGLALGVAFYKLCSLLICHLFHADLVLGFYYVNMSSLVPAALFFIGLDLVTILVNRIRIAVMRPVELLRSMNAGEKEPKVRWLSLVLGIITLGAGYYMALTIENPVTAINMFFIAVLLVMAGTYFLFVAGSIFILKTLKNNRHFYYQKNHMPAVSGLLYRMKQNAVGLASIAILSTGVLLMMSTTVTLYSGYQKTLDKNYPEDMYLTAEAVDEDSSRTALTGEQLTGIIENAAAKNNLALAKIQPIHYLTLMLRADGNDLSTDRSDSGAEVVNKLDELEYLRYIILITEEQYTELTGETIGLADGELAACIMSHVSGADLALDQPVTLLGKDYQIKEKLKDFPAGSSNDNAIISTYGFVVKDAGVLDQILQSHNAQEGVHIGEYTDVVAVTFENRNKAEDAGEQLRTDITAGIQSVAGDRFSYNLDTYWDTKENLLGMYGALLFLGILLGAVCIFATTLIIYYKQISEGYEDRERFQIMEKIGMSQKEVKKTINSQVLMVFLLPLAVAGVHMVVAFPLLTKILRLMSLYSYRLFVVCTMITFAVFAVVYILIYKATSKTYYEIVH